MEVKEAYMEREKLKIDTARRLREHLMRTLNITSEIYVSYTGNVTLRPSIIITLKNHEFVAKIQQSLGIQFLKGLTYSNRVRYYGAKDDVRVVLRSDLPACIKGKKKTKKVTQSRTYFTCPIREV